MVFGYLGEVATWQGLSPNARMVETFANPDTGTWTITITTPDGTTCLAAAGDRYQAVKPGDPA